MSSITKRTIAAKNIIYFGSLEILQMLYTGVVLADANLDPLLFLRRQNDIGVALGRLDRGGDAVLMNVVVLA